MKMPKWILKTAGKRIAKKLDLRDQVQEAEMADAMVKTPWYKSKGKVGAIIFVAVTAVEQLSAAFGHPIKIPEWAFTLMESAGIGLSAFGIRDAMDRTRAGTGVIRQE